MTVASSARLCSVNSTSGKRTLGDMRPNKLSAYLSGAGLVSRNSAAVRREIGSASRCAPATCPCLNARNMARQRPGATLDVTEIQPLPPAARNAKCRCILARKQPEVRAKKRPQPSGASNVAGGVLETDQLRHLGQAGNRFIGKAAGRSRRNIVQDDRQPGGLSDGTEMRVHARLRRLVVIRHDREDRVGPAASASLPSSTAWAVEFEPAPAMTGTRARATPTAYANEVALLRGAQASALRPSSRRRQARSPPR